VPIWKNIPEVILPIVRNGLLANPDPILRAWGMHILEKAPDAFIPYQFHSDQITESDAMKVIDSIATARLLEDAVNGDEGAMQKIGKWTEGNPTAVAMVKEIFERHRL